MEIRIEQTQNPPTAYADLNIEISGHFHNPVQADLFRAQLAAILVQIGTIICSPEIIITGDIEHQGGK